MCVHEGVWSRACAHRGEKRGVVQLLSVVIQQGRARERERAQIATLCKDATRRPTITTLCKDAKRLQIMMALVQ